ncbi:hypothetical protein SDC9_91593 [bioreactor metagenome]|uniref:HTH araC/xylS-type domain-containing protein n=1 Tax=bioreactor metagenome TaxID=1076179 RepID=A0A644ZY92_9ZZZZ
MPLSEYVRKRKLSQAGADLQNSRIRIIDLALKYGYDSADSFTRAFVRQHGITPSQARQTKAFLKIFPPLTFQIKIKGVQGMNWRIEEKKAFEVFGIEAYFPTEGPNKIPDFWTACMEDGRYDQLVKASGNQSEQGICAVNAICGYGIANDKTFPYMLCSFVTEKSKTAGYSTVKVPQMTWAIFRSEPIDALKDIGTKIPGLFTQAYSEWLPSSDYDKADGPDLEIYGKQADSYYEEVWIPVRKK